MDRGVADDAVWDISYIVKRVVEDLKVEVAEYEAYLYKVYKVRSGDLTAKQELEQAELVQGALKSPAAAAQLAATIRSLAKKAVGNGGQGRLV